MEDTPNANEKPEAPPAPAGNPPPERQPGPDPRRRLRELLSIPEGQRTDAQWDEIIELEIQTAPGNRISSPQQRHEPNPHGGQPGGGWKRQGSKPQGKPRKPQKKPGDRQQGGGNKA